MKLKAFTALAIAGAMILGTFSTAYAFTYETYEKASQYISPNVDGQGSNDVLGSYTAEAAIETPSGTIVVSGLTHDEAGIYTAVLGRQANISSFNGVNKTLGLPADVTAAVKAIDEYSDLSKVPGLNLTGYKTLGPSLAIGVFGADLPASVYVSQAPQGTVSILYYNNLNGRWSILPAEYNASTCLVSFTIPASGTAAIITK